MTQERTAIELSRQYSCATKSEKGRILNSLVEHTGWSRDHARRVLRTAPATANIPKRRPGRPSGVRKYSADATRLLEHIWKWAGEISGDYLAATMSDLIDRLTAHGVLPSRSYSQSVINELLSMSGSTINRYLKHQRKLGSAHSSIASHLFDRGSRLATRGARGRAGAVRGSAVLEVIYHCDARCADHLITLCLTDVDTGWKAQLVCTQQERAAGDNMLKRLCSKLPVAVHHIAATPDSGDFSAAEVAWAWRQEIRVTAEGAKQEAQVQEPLPEIARQCTCIRTNTQALSRLIDLATRQDNFLIPICKPAGWVDTLEGRQRVYDEPATPYIRVKNAAKLNEVSRTQLDLEFDQINPALIAEQIADLQTDLTLTEVPRNVQPVRLAA